MLIGILHGHNGSVVAINDSRFCRSMYVTIGVDKCRPCLSVNMGLKF